MVSEILNQFNTESSEILNKKVMIVADLLQEHKITEDQAAILLTNAVIKIVTDKLEVSSGGKILGGCDLSVTNK